jgi:hypothetical protein
MEFVTTSINWHIYFILGLVSIMIFNLISVLKVNDFFELLKRLKLTTPLYHSLNGVVAYTGVIVAAFSHDLSITVFLMLATTIFIMVLEIKRHKKMKYIKVKDIAGQDEFRIFAKKIYMMEIGAILFTFIISKIF